MGTTEQLQFYNNSQYYGEFPYGYRLNNYPSKTVNFNLDCTF